MKIPEPFRPEDVLYRFAPKKNERMGYQAEEYAILREPRNYFGVSMWIRIKDIWENIGNYGEKLLIKGLLADLTAMKEERDGWSETAQKFGLERYEAEAALEAVERERDAYKKALEKYAAGDRGDYARGVLEASKKLKGEV